MIRQRQVHLQIVQRCLVIARRQQTRKGNITRQKLIIFLFSRGDHGIGQHTPSSLDQACPLLNQLESRGFDLSVVIRTANQDKGTVLLQVATL